MRAAVYRRGDLVVDRMPEPVPGEGQVLVKSLACGICGSDLHMRLHAAHVMEQRRRTGGAGMDLGRDVVFGHEFCCEIIEHGPGTEKRLKPGTRVCSMPMTIVGKGVQAVGYSNDWPGGFAERMVLSERFLLPVPNGLSTAEAALTEPIAVGWHAVEMARLQKQDVPLVIGCGPVGLAVIAGLKQKGVGPIIAADFSPGRRGLAEAMGADIVVDPAAVSPYERWRDVATPEGYDARSVAAMLGQGPRPRPAVLFECVGVPGVIQQMLEGAPTGARIVVVGVCMQRDHLEPLWAIRKQLNLQFVLAYTGAEFAESLAHIAEGRIDVTPMITGTIGLDGVAQAFEDLANPERHAKILVEAWR